MAWVLHEGDCLSVLKTLPEASVDAVVTDPPAGIAFMNQEWDDFRRSRNPADAGRDSVFGRMSRRGPEFGPRDRDAFVEWLAERLGECRRVIKPGGYALVWAIPRTSHWAAFALEEAGWTIRDRVTHLFAQGFPKSQSCLKPAAEDWWLAKAPGDLRDLNIDGCRVQLSGGEGGSREGEATRDARYTDRGCTDIAAKPGVRGGDAAGRWPAHVTHDASPEVLEAFAAFGERTSGKQAPGGHVRGSDKFRSTYQPFAGQKCEGDVLYGDTGTAARFFYAAKASKSDRGEGNDHPTVKSTELMRWLVRLVTPPGGTVLDCFAGSGTTGVAAYREGRDCILIEREPAYCDIIRKRMAAEEASHPLFNHLPDGGPPCSTD